MRRMLATEAHGRLALTRKGRHFRFAPFSNETLNILL